MTAEGHASRFVADKIGTSPASVQRIVKRHKVAIKALALAITAQSTKLCLDNHVQTLKLANQILTAPTKETTEIQCILTKLALMGIEPKDILTLSDKKENRALQIMGIVPSHTQSMVINNIFNDNRGQINNPKILAVLDREKTRQMDVIDMPDLGL